MAFVIDPLRLTHILRSERWPHLVEWALAYGCASHPQAAGELALEALSAAERDPYLPEAVVEGLARTSDA